MRWRVFGGFWYADLCSVFRGEQLSTSVHAALSGRRKYWLGHTTVESDTLCLVYPRRGSLCPHSPDDSDFVSSQAC